MAEVSSSCVVSLVRCSHSFIDFVRSTIVICNPRRFLHSLMEMYRSDTCAMKKFDGGINC